MQIKDHNGVESGRIETGRSQDDFFLVSAYQQDVYESDLYNHASVSFDHKEAKKLAKELLDFVKEKETTNEV